MRCEQLTHSAARVKGMHQPRPGAVVVPPAGGGGRCPPVPTRAQAEGSGTFQSASGPSAMALPPPLDSGGEGKQRVGAQSNGGGSSEPRGGKREASERQQAGRSVALWTKQSGAQVPPRRGPPLSPDFPRPPVPPGLAQEGGAQAGQEPSARCLAPGQMGTSASLHARMDGGGSSEQAGKTIDTGKVRRCR